MEMKKYDTGAVREDKTGKGRMDLLPMCALIRLSKHFETSLADHPERNWEKGLPMHSFLDSGIRHLFKYMDGCTDEDHLCAAAWNILCAMWTEEKHPEMQDIPARLEKCVGYPGKDAEQIPGQITIDELNKPYERCDSYHQHCTKSLCYGTKEMEECSCGGNRLDCDFYPENRKTSVG